MEGTPVPVEAANSGRKQLMWVVVAAIAVFGVGVAAALLLWPPPEAGLDPIGPEASDTTTASAELDQEPAEQDAPPVDAEFETQLETEVEPEPPAEPAVEPPPEAAPAWTWATILADEGTGPCLSGPVTTSSSTVQLTLVCASPAVAEFRVSAIVPGIGAVQLGFFSSDPTPTKHVIEQALPVGTMRLQFECVSGAEWSYKFKEQR